MSRAASVHTPGTTNPFTTPNLLSRAPSVDGHTSSGRQSSYFPSSGANGVYPARRRKFKSARLVAGEYDEKPWADSKHPKLKWERAIFYGSVGIGVVIGAVICYFAYASVTNHEYCLILEDNFASIDKNTWSYEIQRGGFGSGSFEWTTEDPKNAYTDAEGLHIVPTLTIESTDITKEQLIDNFVLNLTTSGECTTTGIDNCSIRSNKTAGTIVNPVRSARLSTKGKKQITYGKVEVVAKMPRGDWLWPAIWMMPSEDKYGIWPKSGEIDIAESRGNNGDDYTSGGRDSLISALHWGPLSEADAFWKTSGQHRIRRTDYSEAYHTFGLEWSENYLYTYIDSRLLQVFFIRFNSKYRNMWDRGEFGKALVNHSALYDPWSQTGKPNTPFDQDFYLILNVAVGSTNGFFPDGVGNKPWGDQSPTAMKEFWDGQGAWYPTWGEGDTRGLTVKSVKMWRQGAC
ncbi:glycoside hydrolase family 16 protein [Aaosphaeria arxii CBS 175.79]|uniref:Glycoside hydrolase family 16 protein n=1 Tax=Aaosphaeria arxii CBS 175.79 TaxID=1450172 RepID=A0A6A5Y8R9_9PLEO|nr:glycoside hydrolase family 16 protein [Aaosphaeria arxii CBS 175.79]KAF2021808.1 glycoside hydrolase family 16 protein [Aaosphaeria arxii CBS 175.79]